MSGHSDRLAVPCPACGAEPGQQCRRVAGPGSAQLSRPHTSRGAQAAGRIAEGRALRARRLAAGWTQVELARAAAVTPTLVSRMERLGAGNLPAWVRVKAALARREHEARKTIGPPLKRPDGQA